MCDAVIFPISAASRRSPQVQPFISNELAPSDSHRTTLLLLSDLPSTSIRNTYIRPSFRCSLAHHHPWLRTTPAPD